MPLALTCPPLPLALPPWYDALWPLDWRVVTLILLATLICIALNMLPMRGLPEEQKHVMLPWAIVASALLFASACSYIAIFFVDDRWNTILNQWYDSITSTRGFADCQFAAPDQAYNHALNYEDITFGWVSFIFPWLILFDRAVNYRRTFLASR